MRGPLAITWGGSRCLLLLFVGRSRWLYLCWDLWGVSFLAHTPMRRRDAWHTCMKTNQVHPRHFRGLIEFASAVQICSQASALPIPFVGLSDAGRGLCSHCLHQRYGSHDPRDAFEVVCQQMQAHLGTRTREPLGQEMRRAHPRLEHAERVVYRRLLATGGRRTRQSSSFSRTRYTRKKKGHTCANSRLTSPR